MCLVGVPSVWWGCPLFGWGTLGLVWLAFVWLAFVFTRLRFVFLCMRLEKITILFVLEDNLSVKEALGLSGRHVKVSPDTYVCNFPSARLQ